MKIALAQLNPTVGDLSGNAALILGAYRTACEQGADLVAVPELAVLGYPPKDLLLKHDLVSTQVDALKAVASETGAVPLVVGFVQATHDGEGRGLSNAAAICRDGRVQTTYAKMLLPTYDVFDETRYFDSGRKICILDLQVDGRTRSVGITICEDLWNDTQFDGRQVYGRDPIAQCAHAGVEVILNISASPFEAGKGPAREKLFAEQSKAHGVVILYCNQYGGNDDLVFDGVSAAFDEQGRAFARARTFEEDLLLVDLDQRGACRMEDYQPRVERIRRGLVVGTRDYLRKCGFKEVLIGLSGGIDSAVTAAIAAQAIGAAKVHGVAMPSRYSSDHSVADARDLAENLGISFDVVAIEQPHAAMERALSPFLAGTESGVAEENVQARLRGNILMALSNKFGWLLLTTGNKSELAVGYCTLYGDMCGGLAVLSDVPKIQVYELARHINRISDGPCIPVNSIEKPPSAELKDNQLDQDSLPPYEVLDEILALYVEHDESTQGIAARGFDAELVERIARLVDRNEYKRKQAAVGLKVTSRAFGTGRRVPIAARHH